MNLISLFISFRSIVLFLLNIYLWIILAYCIASMILGFNIAEARNNRFVVAVFNTLAKLVEPALNPIRRILPDMGMMDFSPLILLLLIQYGVPYILNLIFRLLYASQGM